MAGVVDSIYVTAKGGEPMAKVESGAIRPNDTVALVEAK